MLQAGIVRNLAHVAVVAVLVFCGGTPPRSADDIDALRA